MIKRLEKASVQEENMKVYVADSSLVLRKRLVSRLSEIEGVTVVGQAQEAGAALEAIGELKPDVVVLDIWILGGMRGISLLKKLKNSDTALQVLVLTNHSYLQYRRQCSQAGADFFFDKRFDLHNVIKVCTQLATNKG
jgi:DNA-binding NarL/FixJ family response regulator